MWRNYFKTAFRNLLKNKIYSGVNILGLAIGMAACFFIFQYVHFERSYDRFHANAGRLYRVPISYSGSFSNIPTTAANHPALGPAMKAEFPEVQDFARVVNMSIFSQTSSISYTDGGGSTRVFNEDRVFVADPSFLTMFSFPFAEGDPRTALKDPKSVVLSRTMAQKYFGHAEALGKTIVLNKTEPYKVAGVFEDVPENSHLKFDMLISFLSRGSDKWGYDNWWWPEFYNYILLAPGADPKKVEAKFPALIDKYLGPTLKQLNFGNTFYMQPVTDIHLRSHYLKEAEANGSEKEVYFLSLLGVFILVIAWINYINLSTAKSLERAKEVGLRKVVGGTRAQLTIQFISESLLINGFALAVAALIVLACFPFFTAAIGKHMDLGTPSSALWHEPAFWWSLPVVFVVSAWLVGAYPAFVLSGFRPAIVLKGRFHQSAKGILLRKALVSFQFVLSILLIAGTVTVYRQLSYMRTQSLGYNQDQMLVVKAPVRSGDSAFAYKISAFRNSLLSDPAVRAMTASTDIPGKMIQGRNSVRKATDDVTHNFVTYMVETDEHFLPAFQIPLVAGRNFEPTDTADLGMNRQESDTRVSRVIVNEDVIKALGYASNEAAIHQRVIFRPGPRNETGEIIGVVKSYHQRSLRDPYDPILYYYPNYPDWSYFSVRVGGDYRHGIAAVEDAYKKIFPGQAFDYFFLNEYFNRQYEADQRFGSVFALFTGLAIFVACLGLLGLSSFVIRLRTREIGIRKVLGATVFNILTLFSKDFALLVGFAALIATPAVYWGVKAWLSNYAFHVPLGWFVFVGPPLLLLALALGTVWLQSLKAALANPVESIHE